MLTWLGGWLVNPALLATGSLLVAAPIIIHLLSQRRHQTLDWAAMEFLLQAEQRNRRRIRLEELLLLALRCLAVFLAALLVARPFWPNRWTPAWLTAERQEYVVVLDDSPSLGAREAGGVPFDLARKLIEQLVTDAANRAAGDTLTLVRTSQPSRPLFQDLPLDSATAASVVEELSRLSPSDVPCRWGRICQELAVHMAPRTANRSRTLSLLTDLRETDWTAAAVAALKEFMTKTEPRTIVDVAADVPANLAVTKIESDPGVLFAGRPVRFQVTVKNFGIGPAANVAVQLQVAGSLPMKTVIPTIGPHAAETVSFAYAAAAAGVSPETPLAEPIEVQATLTTADALAADNRYDFASQILPAIPTLIVDGDPSSEYGQSESFFLARALQPPGQLLSGVTVETITEAEFDQQPLGRAQLIHLCNLYQMSEARRSALEAWVADGGGLVIWSGGQLDDRHYNADWYRDGQGLLPSALDGMQGDDTEATWTGLSIEAADHPALTIFRGDGAALIESAKIFRWWQCREPVGPDIRVLARFTNDHRTPAILERRFGRGRVLFLAFPADSDWTDWPETAGYVIFLQEVTRALADAVPTLATHIVGTPLLLPLDVRTHRPHALLTPPGGEPTGKTAVLAGEQRWQWHEENVTRRGVYHWELTRLDDRTERLPMAVNLPVEESDLQRLTPEAAKEAFGSVAVDVVRGREWFTTSIEQGSSELWRWVLAGLLGVLFAEQAWAGWIAQARR